MSFLKMDPSLELSEVPIFKWTAITFIIGAIIMAIVIAYNSSLKLDPSFTGFNFAFFTVFKVPLAFAATGIAIIGIIAAIHRSAQIKLQIETSTEQIYRSSEQDTFTNFYKHREEFENHFQELHSDLNKDFRLNVTKKDMRNYYNLFYPDNNPKCLKLIAEQYWLNSIEDELIGLCYHLTEINNINNTITIKLLLYKKYLDKESVLRKELLNFGDMTSARIRSGIHDKIIKLRLPYGQTIMVDINSQNNVFCFNRINEYILFIETLKNISDSKEPSKLANSKIYSQLIFEEVTTLFEIGYEPIKALYDQNLDEFHIKVSEETHQEYLNSLERIDNLHIQNRYSHQI